MSITDTLRSLRPADASAHAIRAAITAAEAEHHASAAREAAAKARLPALLLGASDAEIDEEEGIVARASRDQQRVTAVITALREQLPAAERAEAVEAVRKAVDAANALAHRFAIFYREQYPQIASALVEGLRIEAEAVEAYRQARFAMDRHQQHIDGTTRHALVTAAGLLAGPENWARVVGAAVALPVPDPAFALAAPGRALLAWDPARAPTYV